MLRKGVTSVKLAMEKLEHFLELGGTKKDITLLVISGIALIVSIFDLGPLPFDASWAAIFLCGIPIILEAVIGLVTAFDIKADVLVSLALIASVCIGEDFAAGEVAFIMQFGGLLEELTVARARAGIDKLAHIRAYQAAGDKVCTIGDGVSTRPRSRPPMSASQWAARAATSPWTLRISRSSTTKSRSCRTSSRSPSA